MISNLHSLQSAPPLNQTNLMSLPSMINSLTLSTSSTMSNVDYIVNKETLSITKNDEPISASLLSQRFHVISNSDDDDTVNFLTNNNRHTNHQSEIINQENLSNVNCIHEENDEKSFCHS